jgi:hypothetical protein
MKRLLFGIVGLCLIMIFCVPAQATLLGPMNPTTATTTTRSRSAYDPSVKHSSVTKVDVRSGSYGDSVILATGSGRARAGSLSNAVAAETAGVKIPQSAQDVLSQVESKGSMFFGVQGWFDVRE